MNQGGRWLSWRQEIRPRDRQVVFDLAASTGFFSPEEIEIACELVEERLAKGEKSGYFFLFAETGGEVLGYSCFGPIMGTRGSYDLYWIVVKDGYQGLGVGGKLIEETETLIAGRGGRRIYADTSSRPQYAPTRGFYRACGYEKEAELVDFYAPGDGKIIYVKVLPSDTP